MKHSTYLRLQAVTLPLAGILMFIGTACLLLEKFL